MADAHGHMPELLAQARWIRNLARHLVGDGPAAEDLVQETWLAALRRAPDGDRPLRPWLARVARNAARQSGRRRWARPAHESLSEVREPREAPGDGGAPDELLQRGEEQARLVNAVLALREPFRSTVLLRFYEGLGTDEIARREGVARATVRSRLSRATADLRERLDADHGGDRSVWVQALAPLATPQLVWWTMKLSTGKVTAALAATVLLIWAGSRGPAVFHRRPDAASSVAHRGALAAPRESTPVPAPSAPRPAIGEERAEVVSEAVRSAPAPLTEWSGVLRDARTHEPLPDYLVELHHGARVRRMSTDERGRLRLTELTEAERAGPMDIRLLDHPDLPLDADQVRAQGLDLEEAWLSVRLEPVQGDQDLPVAAGPTYALELRSEAALPLDQMIAWVVPAGMAFRDPVARPFTAPVRTGGGHLRPWVRFLPLPADLMPRRGPWTLQVYSRDGTWFGSAEVDSIVGAKERPVLIELEPRGRLRVQLRDAAGAPVAQAALALRAVESPVADSEARESVQLTSRTDEAGRALLEWMPPGAYRLEVDPVRHAAVGADLRLRARQTTELELALDALPTFGAVGGELRSRTGDYRREVIVFLDGQGPGAPDLNQSPEWRVEDGEYVARFAFEDLPEEAYVLSVLSLHDSLPWSPGPRRVEPPRSQLVFEVRDDLPTTTLTLAVVDAEDGASIEPFRLLYSIDGAGLMAKFGLGAEGPHLTDLVAGTELRWSVDAAGYAPAFGDPMDLELTAQGGLDLRVELRRGWGARFVVLDGATGEPLSGATIELDGEPVARTDASGWVTVYAAEAPDRVRAVHGDSSASVSPDEGLAFQGSIELH